MEESYKSKSRRNILTIGTKQPVPVTSYRHRANHPIQGAEGREKGRRLSVGVVSLNPGPIAKTAQTGDTNQQGNS